MWKREKKRKREIEARWEKEVLCLKQNRLYGYKICLSTYNLNSSLYFQTKLKQILILFEKILSYLIIMSKIILRALFQYSGSTVNIIAYPVFAMFELQIRITKFNFPYLALPLNQI